MWIIRRYILKEFIFYFLSCLLSLIFIAVVFAALAELKTLDGENGQKLFMEAILSGIPLLIEIITPISVLLATILTFISLSKSSEVIAMMAAGVSLAKMVFPVFAAGCVIGLFGYLNQSYLAPLWGADERTSMVDSTPVNNLAISITVLVWRVRVLVVNDDSPPASEHQRIRLSAVC